MCQHYSSAFLLYTTVFSIHLLTDHLFDPFVRNDFLYRVQPTCFAIDICLHKKIICSAVKSFSSCNLLTKTKIARVLQVFFEVLPDLF